jgi:hypothetical protein
MAALFSRALIMQVDETHSDFEPVLPDTNIQRAVEPISIFLSTGTRKYRAIP